MSSRFLLSAMAAASLGSVPLTADLQELPATPRAEVRFDQATARAFDRSGRYVTATQRADGLVLTELNGSFQNVTVARVGPGGTIETYCTTSQEDATRWMAREGDVPPSPGTFGPPAEPRR